MQQRDLYPHEILQDVIDKSYAKSIGSVKTLAILSFLGGGGCKFWLYGIFKSRQWYTGGVGWIGNIIGGSGLSYLLNLYSYRRWRIGHGEHDDDGFGAIKQTGKFSEIIT